MAQIQAKWPKSSQKTQIFAWGPSFWPLRPMLWPPKPRFFWALWLSLDHFAWIWAIWPNEQTKGRMDWQMDGQTDSPCVLQDFVLFGAAAQPLLNLNHTLLKQGTGTADHLPPLGCYCFLFFFTCIYHDCFFPLCSHLQLSRRLLFFSLFAQLKRFIAFFFFSIYSKRPTPNILWLC